MHVQAVRRENALMAVFQRALGMLVLRRGGEMTKKERRQVSLALQVASGVLAMIGGYIWSVPLMLAAWGVCSLAWSVK
jgi:hypothetical protein